MTASTFTAYDPSGHLVAGNSTVLAVDAIANINAPTAAELNTTGAVAIQCAMEEFGITTDVSWRERKKLCDKIATQSPGNRTFGMSSELRITLDDPQGDEQRALDKFVIDGVVYLVHRPGKPHTAPFVAGDKVQVVKAIVGAVDLAPINTDEGAEYDAVVQVGIQEMNDGLLVSVA